MHVVRQKFVLLVILILIASMMLTTRYGERGSIFSTAVSSYSSVSTLYHEIPLRTCPPPPFEC